MNKMQIICPLATMALALLILLPIAGRQYSKQSRIARIARAGRQLTLHTNFNALVFADANTSNRLARFMLDAVELNGLRVGDEPAPVGDGRASARLYLRNAHGNRLGLRVTEDSDRKRVRVLGLFTPPASTNVPAR